jgi:hypothetical protein
MRIRRIPKTETLGYCHDCHNRARIEVTSRIALRSACAIDAVASWSRTYPESSSATAKMATVRN